MNNVIKNAISQLFERILSQQILSIQFIPVTGGSINETFRVIINKNRSFFLKIHSSQTPGLLQKEKAGLDFLRHQHIIPTPLVIEHQENPAGQILILEWIESGEKTRHFWRCFGQQLSQLHKVTTGEFGFTEDNYMGTLPQVNNSAKKWTDFFIHSRLGPQVTLALQSKLLQPFHISLFESLNKKLNNFFEDEKPSLLHGDLWSGNFICDTNSQPVIIDPAIYFGHRSMDLGMTTLFGGFDKAFYEAYHFNFPFPAGYKEQWEICNLYPLLVHLNLFGEGYLQQIDGCLRKYA